MSTNIQLSTWAAKARREGLRFKQVVGKWNAQGRRAAHAGQVNGFAVNDAARDFAHAAQRAWHEALLAEREAQPVSADVLVDGLGESVLRFTFVPNSGARTWFEEHVETAPWQWLGAHVLGVEHRYAVNLVAALRDAGFTVKA